MAGGPEVRRSVEVRATPEEVWATLVDPDALSAWFGGPARLDVRPGGTGRLTTEDGEVRLAVVEEVDAPRRLVFSWWPLHRSGDATPGPHDRSRVTITIDPDEDPGADGAPVHVHVEEEVVARVRRPSRPTTIGFPGRGAGTRPGTQARARRVHDPVGGRPRMSSTPPDDDAALVFAALADPTRRSVLGELARRPSATATELAVPLAVSRQAVVKHLQQLAEAGLVEGERAGREMRFHVCAEPLGDAVAWIADVGGRWDQRLERLRTRLEGRGGTDAKS